jgi:hypothetical protein
MKNLHDDILGMIFEYLPTKEFCKISELNKHFKRYSEDNDIWKEHSISTYKILNHFNPKKGYKWKYIYLENFYFEKYKNSFQIENVIEDSKFPRSTHTDHVVGDCIYYIGGNIESTVEEKKSKGLFLKFNTSLNEINILDYNTDNLVINNPPEYLKKHVGETIDDIIYIFSGKITI